MNPQCTWEDGCTPDEHVGFVHPTTVGQLMEAIGKERAYDPDGDPIVRARANGELISYHYLRGQSDEGELDSTSALLHKLLVPEDEVTEAELAEVLQSLGVSSTPASNPLADAARAFVELYEDFDGVADEMSSRDFRITQEYYQRYLAAKAALEG